MGFDARSMICLTARKLGRKHEAQWRAFASGRIVATTTGASPDFAGADIFGFSGERAVCFWFAAFRAGPWKLSGTIILPAYKFPVSFCRQRVLRIFRNSSKTVFSR